MSQGLSQKKEFLVAVAFVLGCFLILGSGVWFLTSKVIVSSANLQDKKAAVELVYQSWQETGSAQRELEKVKPQLEKINQIFVLKDQPLDFVKMLEDLARKTDNLYLINLVTPAEETKKADTLSFQIQLDGSFVNLMHFVKYLENMKYYTEIDSMQINQIGVGETPNEDEWKEVAPGSIYSVINLKVLTQ